MKKIDIIKNGIFKENPIFTLLLGLCSSLAITTNLTNAIGMGLAVTAVLILSNAIISAMRKIKKQHPELEYFFIPRKYKCKDFSDLRAMYGKDKTKELIIEALKFIKNL